MTYGEEAQIFPVAQIYDTGVMKDYIAAARAEYERGLADYEKFMSKYGDFSSRSPYDVQQWNKYTVDGISDILNKAQAAGVDMRSPELRAELRKFERSLPKTELAALKQNAADYDAWTAAQQRLIQEGKYDPEYAKMEGLGPSEFRTINPETGEINIFGRTSPTPILDMKSFSDPMFKDLKPNKYIWSEEGQTYQYEGIDPTDIRNTAINAYEYLSQTPQGQLILKRYKNEGLSEEEAKQKFINDVATSQTGKIYKIDSYDDGFKVTDASERGWAQIGIARQNADTSRIVAESKAAAQKKEAEQQSPLTITDRIQGDVDENKKLFGNKLKKAEEILKIGHQYKKSGYKGVSFTNETYQALADNYDAYQMTPRNDDQKFVRGLMASNIRNLDKQEANPFNSTNKGYVVMMNDKDVHLTRSRQLAYGGFGEFTENSPTRTFEKFLKQKGVQAYMADNTVTVNWNSQLNKSVYDINAIVTVPFDQVKEYFDKHKNAEELIGKLGLRFYTFDGKVIDEKDEHKLLNKAVKYVSFSVTRTVNGTAMTEASINTSQYIDQFGKGAGKKQQTAIQDEALEELDLSGIEDEE